MVSSSVGLSLVFLPFGVLFFSSVGKLFRGTSMVYSLGFVTANLWVFLFALAFLFAIK